MCLAINYITAAGGEGTKTEIYIFSNSCSKRSIFLGGVRKYFPKLNILTSEVQSFK